MENHNALRSVNESDHHSIAWTTASSSLSSSPPLPDVFNNIQIEVLGPPYTRNPRIALLTLMIITAFFGNVAVIINISLPCRHHQHKLRRIQILFINLAVADLFVCIFTMTSQLIWECMGREWVGGDLFCSIFKVLQTFAMVCSNYLIVSIAVDRYYAVVHPLRRRPRTSKYVFGAWLASLLPSYPNFHIFQQYIDPSGRAFCVAKYYTGHLPRIHRQIYMGLIITSVFIFPICITGFMYARVVKVVWSRPRAFLERMSSSESMATCTSNNSHHPNYSNAFFKTFWMTLIVVVSFLCCTLPYCILEIMIALGKAEDLNEDVVAMLGIMSAANSSINPYVYLISNMKCCSAKKRGESAGCLCCASAPSQRDSSKVIMSTSV